METTQGKKLSLFLDSLGEPKILITYQINETKKLVNDKVWIWVTNDGKKRYRGELPLIFIRKDLINDYETLYCANVLNNLIKEKIVIEKEPQLIKMLRKLHYNHKWLQFKEEVIFDYGKDVVIRKPSVLYTIYEKEMFTKLPREVIEENRKRVDSSEKI